MIKPSFLAGAALTLASSLALAQTTTTCTVPDGGRLLASGCFQCHGTNGQNGTFNAVAGGSQQDMLNKLKDMRTKTAGSSIMNPHARGYTNAQLACITLYFSKQAKL
jgi:sulfide dehydrogenase cytochrome subunit